MKIKINTLLKRIIPIILVLGMNLCLEFSICANGEEWITVNVDLTIEQQS